MYGQFINRGPRLVGAFTLSSLILAESNIRGQVVFAQIESDLDKYGVQVSDMEFVDRLSDDLFAGEPVYSANGSRNEFYEQVRQVMDSGGFDDHKFSDDYSLTPPSQFAKNYTKHTKS